MLAWLRDSPGQGYRFLSSLHAADYLPAEPRFAVHYELLNRDGWSGARQGIWPDPAATDELPEIDSCGELFPTAEFQEREAFDFFGIVFRGHPDLPGSCCPRTTWVGRSGATSRWRRAVTFTYNERNYG